MRLRLAKPGDLSTVLDWVADEHACRLWAGPGVYCSDSPATVWNAIGADRHDTCALVDDDGGVWGFGQVLFRPSGVVHLARLIVDPACRRRGHGRRLCLALMARARERSRVERFTLNVYASNTRALSLYRSLGFIEQGGVDADELVHMGTPGDSGAR